LIFSFFTRKKVHRAAIKKIEELVKLPVRSFEVAFTENTNILMMGSAQLKGKSQKLEQGRENHREKEAT
jgi:hypothetical protein